VFSTTKGPPVIFSVKKKKRKISRLIHERKETQKMIILIMYRHKNMQGNEEELDVHGTNFIANITPDDTFIIYQTVPLDF
jgi:hypothetical protein